MPLRPKRNFPQRKMGRWIQVTEEVGTPTSSPALARTPTRVMSQVPARRPQEAALLAGQVHAL